MSSYVLRKAADDMRLRAQSAARGRWGVWGMTVQASADGSMNADTATDVAQVLTTDDNGRPRTWDADYIVRMQPTVALVIADWLTFTATAREAIDMVAAHDPERAMGSEASKCFTDLEAHAVNVARAYLGVTP